MFKVHLPAKSLRKQPKVTAGSAELLALLNPMIIKSGRLHFVGDGLNNGRAHNWNPTIGEDGESPHGVSTDLDTHDHPPWNHHPETGDLLEGGQHPIDFSKNYLMRKLGMSEEQAILTLQRAIDRYNAKHDAEHGEGNSAHTLPDFDSPEWRKVFVGPLYDHRDPSHMRPVRGADPLFEGGPRPMITYALNNANVNARGASTGRWIDSGLLHMNREIGEELTEQGYSPQEVNRLKIVQYNRLLPRDLSGGVVQAWSGQQVEEAMRSGSIPEQFRTDEQVASLSEQRAHPDIYAHQVAKLLPDSFYHVSSGLGGRTGNVAPDYLENMMKEAGIPIDTFTPEELAQIGSTRAMKMLFQTTHKLDSHSGGGAVKTLSHAVFRDMDSITGSPDDWKDPVLNDHLTHAAGAADTGGLSLHRRANRVASNFIAHITHVASKLVEGGMGEDEAKAEAVRRMRESEASTKSKFTAEEGIREKTEALIDAMLGHTGHEAFSLDNITLPTGRAATGLPEDMMESHSEIPQHWDKRIIIGNHEMAPIGGGEMQEEAAPVAPPVAAPPAAPPVAAPPVAAPPAAPPVAPPQGQRTLFDRYTPPAPAMASAYPTRQASPLEQQYHQMLGTDPAQRTFDIGSGALVQRSNDTVSSIDDIMKKIEMVQVLDARQDPTITKMLPNKSVSIDSFWDVQIIAKSLGLTSVDVHGLYQSQGDWYKIANQWNVQPEVVKAVKVAFGGN